VAVGGGGDGTTFGVPALRGRLPMDQPSTALTRIIALEGIHPSRD
jgi:microcystin-dependent protein